VDDRPENRVVVGIGDRDGQGRAEAHAVFCALDPNPVVSISVHDDPSSRERRELVQRNPLTSLKTRPVDAVGYLIRPLCGPQSVTPGGE